MEVQSPGVASWQLSMVPVSLIQFAAQWGRIKGCGPGLVGETRQFTLMQTLACESMQRHRLKDIVLTSAIHLCEGDGVDSA